MPSPRAWTLGPRIGLGFSQTRDEVLGPLTYRGVQPVLGAAFAHDRASNRHEAQLELLPAYKTDRFGYRGIFFTQRLEYRYLRELLRAPENDTRVGLYLTPRDLARFGQMVLDGGQWQGRRIVSGRWLDQATAVRVERPDGWHYGYYFWIDSERGYVAARGHGGQRAVIVPEHDLMVAITAEPTGAGDKGISLSEIDDLLAGVIAAIRD